VLTSKQPEQNTNRPGD